jgi:hypothetical protein
MFAVGCTTTLAATYYLDSELGNDGYDGRSIQKAWATLERANEVEYEKGDTLLIKRGTRYSGTLSLIGLSGTSKQPIIVEAYGSATERPLIDGKGYLAALSVTDAEWVVVKNLSLTSDGGDAIEEKAHKERIGAYVKNARQITLDGIHAKRIFATIATKSEGKRNVTAYGHGIRIEDSQGIDVFNCVVTETGHFGIHGRRSANITVKDCKTDHTGCSGIQFNTSTNVLIQGSVFNNPGSFIDERMHGRGSGSWVWGCENVRYDRNHFLNARGKGDSCGVHIDFNCRNIVVERCFSMNNEGGFIEILGNNFNCAYRYNISVNDGFRKKGKDGAHQEGKVFWLSGYQGSRKPPYGPFHSYIYNNTIYVKEDALARFSVSPTTRGALVANNIFHLLGPTEHVGGDQKKYKKNDSAATGIIFANNLYVREGLIPPGFVSKEEDAIVGDVCFTNPGGARPEDYVPLNRELIVDRGMVVQPLPEDEIGLSVGLEVTEDFFGNPVQGRPDIGAVELDPDAKARSHQQSKRQLR